MTIRTGINGFGRMGRLTLRAYGIDKTSAQLLAVHQHNEAEAALAVVQRLQQGLRVAYVSDAGTPGVSDPGARLVAAVHSAGLRALPLPGASSITTALSVAGAVAHSTQSSGFLFAGFLPVKNAERATAVQQLASEPRCVVLLEAPHRIDELAQALAVLGDRPVTLARELTKQFEEIATHPARELTAWLQGSPQRSRGEFVVLLHPTAPAADDGDSLRVLRLLLQELPLKTAVRLAAEVTGASIAHDRLAEDKSSSALTRRWRPWTGDSGCAISTHAPVDTSANECCHVTRQRGRASHASMRWPSASAWRGVRSQGAGHSSSSRP